MLRDLRPDLTIGFFLHIPFPPVELFMQLPWRAEIIEGLLGADLVGFHLPGGAQNFLILSRRLIGTNTSRGSIGVRSRFGEGEVDGRTVRSDLVGFHLPGGAQNFLILSRRLIGTNTSRGSIGVRSRFGEVEVDGRTVRGGAFPISIDSPELRHKARPAPI